MQNVEHTPAIIGLRKLCPTVSPCLLKWYIWEATELLPTLTKPGVETETPHYEYHLYALVRAHKPEVMVATGLAYDVATALTLHAMNANKKGHLHACNDTLIESDRYNSAQHERLTFYSMSSQTALPRIDPRTWDLFLHDGTGDKTFEYDYAFKHVRDDGIIATDDYTWGNPPWPWEVFLVKNRLHAVTGGHMSMVRI